MARRNKNTIIRTEMFKVVKWLATVKSYILQTFVLSLKHQRRSF